MDIRKCCDLLDLPPGYSQADLKQSYKDLVQVWHPDRFAHSERLKAKAENKLKQINLAYEVLDQALIKRTKLEAARATQASDVSREEEIVRAAYEQSVAWGRPGQRLRLQLSMVLWTAAVCAGFFGLIALLSILTTYPIVVVGLCLVAGSYAGARWFHDRQ